MSFKYIMPPKIKGKKPRKPKQPTQKQTVIINIGATRRPLRKKGPTARREKIQQQPLRQIQQPSYGTTMLSTTIPTAQQVAYEVKRINEVKPKQLNESQIRNIFDEYFEQEKVRASRDFNLDIPKDTKIDGDFKEELPQAEAFVPIQEVEPLTKASGDFNATALRMRDYGLTKSGTKRTKPTKEQKKFMDENDIEY